MANVNIRLEVKERENNSNYVIFTNKSNNNITNYPLQFGRVFVKGEILNYPQISINGSLISTQADVKNRYDDGSVKFAILATILPNVEPDLSLNLNFVNQLSGNNEPLTKEQMLNASFDFDAKINLNFTSGVIDTISAREMLQTGDYKLWTSGQIAQTVEIADDGIDRKYDVGNGDGFRPFRPRFYVTFWSLINKTMIRFVGENGLTTELEDLSYYLSLSLGNQNSYNVYDFDLTGTQSIHPKKHWSRTNWTKIFWLRSAPENKININHNIKYLSSTKIIPNFDSKLVISEETIVSEYNKWTTKPHNWYDGSHNGGIWTVDMRSGGGRSEIAPYPGWSVFWLYTGDWRMKEFALGMADLASAWPANLRENNPNKNLLLSDSIGAGTGLGHAISITNRKTFWGGDPINVGAVTGDQVKVVGPIAGVLITLNNPISRQWYYNDAHLPQPFYVQYILTGDKYYLNMLYNWAAMSAANVGSGARGPVGNEGVINIDLAIRADAWILRSRVETAFIAPDVDREKKYFTDMIHATLARWEGGFGITGTVYDGTSLKNWGVSKRNFHTLRATNGTNAGQVPPLKNWQSAEQGDGAPVYNFVIVGGQTPIWMQSYMQGSLGRAVELGFAAEKIRDFSGQFFISMINESNKPWLINDYLMPVIRKISVGGGFFQTWEEVISMIPSSYLASLENKYDGTTDGYSHYILQGMAYLVDAEVLGAMEAWKWLRDNVYLKTNFSTDPRWAIVPRKII